MPHAWKCTLAGGLLIAMSPGIAGAALGEPETSVQADGVQLLASSVKVTEHAAYRQHEVQLPSGTRLREFTGADGKVFAVAWSGPTIPNLREIMGRYFDTYVAAAKGKHTGHSHLLIQESGLVVESTGHMRAFAGRAYLPQAVPNGVDLGELR
jgi:hypothetical protein